MTNPHKEPSSHPLSFADGYDLFTDSRVILSSSSPLMAFAIEASVKPNKFVIIVQRVYGQA